MQVCCTFLVVRRRLVFLMASFAWWLVCFKERKKERKELRWEWRAWGLIVAWMVVEITLENISQVNILENISQFFFKDNSWMDSRCAYGLIFVAWMGVSRITLSHFVKNCNVHSWGSVSFQQWCANCVDKMKWIENPRTMINWIIVKLFALLKLPSPTSGLLI